MPVTKIPYKGLDVLFIDYKPCKSLEEEIESINQLAEMTKPYPPNGAYLMVDVTGKQGSKRFMAEAKRLAKEVFDDRVRTRAVIGVNNPGKKILIAVYNHLVKSKFHLVKDQQEALEYLHQISLK